MIRYWHWRYSLSQNPEIVSISAQTKSNVPMLKSSYGSTAVLIYIDRYVTVFLPDFIWYLRKSHGWRPSNQIPVCPCLCPFFGHCLYIGFSDIRWYSSQEKHLEPKYCLINIFLFWNFKLSGLFLDRFKKKCLLLLKYEYLSGNM